MKRALTLATFVCAFGPAAVVAYYIRADVGNATAARDSGPSTAEGVLTCYRGHGSSVSREPCPPFAKRLLLKHDECVRVRCKAEQAPTGDLTSVRCAAEADTCWVPGSAHRDGQGMSYEVAGMTCDTARLVARQCPPATTASTLPGGRERLLDEQAGCRARYASDIPALSDCYAGAWRTFHAAPTTTSTSTTTLPRTLCTAATAPPLPAHPCGYGPHDVQMRSGPCCGCPSAPTPPRRVVDDTYELALSIASSACCPCPSYKETWTDWPECPGARATRGLNNTILTPNSNFPGWPGTWTGTGTAP